MGIEIEQDIYQCISEQTERFDLESTDEYITSLLAIVLDRFNKEKPQPVS